MKLKMNSTSHRKSSNWHRSVAVAAIGLVTFGTSSCTSDDLSGMGSALDQGLDHVSGYVPMSSDARRAVSAIRALKAIAEYQASEKQLASARAKTSKASSSSERQYIRVKPDPKATESKSKGTHVVAYEPSTGKLDDEVVVVSDTGLSRGDSVSINGQSGKII
ncbi:MAG: hypothetical protein ACR2RV_00510 [Verrucomicrobiales bacterium]